MLGRRAVAGAAGVDLGRERCRAHRACLLRRGGARFPAGDRLHRAGHVPGGGGRGPSDPRPSPLLLGVGGGGRSPLSGNRPRRRDECRPLRRQAGRPLAGAGGGRSRQPGADVQGAVRRDAAAHAALPGRGAAHAGGALAPAAVADSDGDASPESATPGGAGAAHRAGDAWERARHLC